MFVFTDLTRFRWQTSLVCVSVCSGEGWRGHLLAHREGRFQQTSSCSPRSYRRVWCRNLSVCVLHHLQIQSCIYLFICQKYIFKYNMFVYIKNPNFAANTNVIKEITFHERSCGKLYWPAVVVHSLVFTYQVKLYLEQYLLFPSRSPKRIIKLLSLLKWKVLSSTCEQVLKVLFGSIPVQSCFCLGYCFGSIRHPWSFGLDLGSSSYSMICC